MTPISPRLLSSLPQYKSPPAAEEVLTVCHVKALQLGGTDLSKLTCREVLFEGCSFAGSSLYKADFRDVLFRGCDFSNADCTSSYWYRCRLEDCKGVGMLLPDSRLQSVVFQNGSFRYANLFLCRCREVLLDGANFEEANLSECQLEHFMLQGANLNGASFVRTPLSGIDFTSSQADGLAVTGPELKGAVVTAFQAAELSRLLGLIIK